MLSEITGFRAIYIYCGKCDLRKGIDGLATLVKEQFHLGPFQKEVLFLFCGCALTDSKAWSGKEMDLFCFISAWRMVGFNGHGHRKKSDRSRSRNSAGFWKDYVSTNPKQ